MSNFGFVKLNQFIVLKPSQIFLDWFPLLAGFSLLYLPTYYNLFNTIWSTDEQGHGPFILMIAFWLFWTKRHLVYSFHSSPGFFVGGLILAVGLIFFTIGRSQAFQSIEVLSQIPVIVGILLLMKGYKAVLAYWFPLVFLLFMVPLPSSLVATLTLPLKMAVSWAVDQILYAAGYPISRSGVILQLGQYKLLVADTCAGLYTLFTLESLGLVYLHLVKRESLVRNVALAVAIVPISFVANVIRVTALSLITFHYGEHAGNGFLHNFAGIILFMTALLLIVGVDFLIGKLLELWRNIRVAQSKDYRCP